MNKIILALIGLLFTLNIFGQSQRKEAIEEKIKSLRIAFITEKLSLTPEESEKFWPVYNQLEAEKKALNTEKKMDKNVDLETMNDKDAQSYINRHFELKEKETLLEKKNVEKLKTILPTKKIAKLLWVEKQFRQEIMTNIINKRKNR
jgi:hypothetical protein